MVQQRDTNSLGNCDKHIGIQVNIIHLYQEFVGEFEKKRYEGKLLLRAADMEDLNSVQGLVTACDVDEFGTADFAINMTEIFQSVTLDKNTWIVHTEDNKIIGHAYMEEMGKGRLDTYVFTHPEYKGLGIGMLLAVY